MLRLFKVSDGGYVDFPDDLFHSSSYTPTFDYANDKVTISSVAYVLSTIYRVDDVGATVIHNKYGRQVAFSAGRQFDIVPDDGNDVTYPGCQLWLSEAGSVCLTLLDDQSGHTGKVWTDMAAGYHPIQIRRLWDTGTTNAGEIIGLI